MTATKYIAGLLLAFLLGIAIMILFYERFFQPNFESIQNVETSLSLYDYAQNHLHRRLSNMATAGNSC